MTLLYVEVEDGERVTLPPGMTELDLLRSMLRQVVAAAVGPCARCGHPEVVHGGFARPDGSCAYRECKCARYVQPTSLPSSQDRP